MRDYYSEPRDYGGPVGIVIGVLVFVLLFVGVGLYSYGRWNDNIARAKVHHPDWKIGQATVISDNQPDFSDSPPDRYSVVQFTDFYGHMVSANIHLPYRSNIGDHIQIDVGRAGNIFVPADPWNDQNEQSNPLAAHPNVWPAGGILIGGILSFFIAVFIGVCADEFIDWAPSIKGRLGVR